MSALDLVVVLVLDLEVVPVVVVVAAVAAGLLPDLEVPVRQECTVVAVDLAES